MSVDRHPDPTGSLLERLRRDFGVQVDPHIELESEGERSPAEPRAGSSGSSGASGVVERLKERAALSTRYRVEGEVARGGMGAILRVWDGDLRRRVAMKVALDTRGEGSGSARELDPRLLARFLEEAQVTGQLEHPGIVPVHELGLADDGRVYFTMRLVRGRDLEAIFDLVGAGLEGWSVTRALGVLLKVCEAMAYAHSKGVVHRDLKPANVMVGHFGEVYVMDWGLVRVQGQEDRHDLRLQRQPTAAREPGVGLDLDRRQDASGASGEELYTMDGDVVGTPAYMPPEQARGELEGLDARSDVYAVGAMLYRLLAGLMPYGSREERRGSAQVLADLLAGPPVALERLAPQAPAELVAICDKAMARDPRARYPDMLALAEDLRAFLEHRVVRAHETGALAEARKWVRRNRALAASLAAGVLALAGGLVASLVLRGRAEASAASARRQARIAEEVNDFLNRDLLAAVRPEEQGIDVSLREALDVAARRLEGRFPGEPAVEAELRGTIATSLEKLGELEPAREQAERALELVRSELGEDAQATLAAMGRVASVWSAQRRDEEALELYGRVVEGLERTLGGEHRATLAMRSELALVLQGLGRFEEARALFGEVLRAQERVLGPEDEETLVTMNNLGGLLIDLGDYEQGEAILREVVALRRGRDGDRHPDTLAALGNLAIVLVERGRLEESEALQREAQEGRRAVFGPDHYVTAGGLGDLAAVLLSQGRLQEARETYEEALEGMRRALGADHPRTLLAQNNLAIVVERLGDGAEALRLRLETLEGQQRVLGPRHPQTLLSISNLGMLYQGLERYDEAEGMMLEALAGQREVLGPDHPSTLGTLENLANLSYERGAYERSLELVGEVLEARQRVLGPDHPDVAKTLFNMGMLAVATGDDGSALELFREALRRGRAALGPEHPQVAESLRQIGDLLCTGGEHDQAVESYREALAIRRALGSDEAEVSYLLHQLGYCFGVLGRYEEAVEAGSEALALRRRLYGDDHPYTLVSLYTLASGLLEAERFEGCEPLALELHERVSAAGSSSAVSSGSARSLLERLYAAWGRPEDAEVWR